MRSGSRRRLKSEPTKSTSGSRARSLGRVVAPAVTPGGMTTMRDGVDAETRFELRSRELRVGEDDGGARARRGASASAGAGPSRGRNHSGCATNEMSWMVTASGTGEPSGAV